MTDRDHFAAAALTGLLANHPVYGSDHAPKRAFELADAMLRERERTNHDAVPAAIAVSDEARTDKAATSHRRDRSGNTPVAESATPDGYACAGWPHPKGKMASISDAEIDALEFVVEEGRIASQMDYGVLRSLLVRLRPEWLDRPQPVIGGQSDRPKPIDGPDPDSRVWETQRTPQPQTTPSECNRPREGT